MEQQTHNDTIEQDASNNLDNVARAEPALIIAFQDGKELACPGYLNIEETTTEELVIRLETEHNFDLHREVRLVVMYNEFFTRYYETYDGCRFDEQGQVRAHRK